MMIAAVYEQEREPPTASDPEPPVTTVRSQAG
jgi:hypothetical protein